MACCSAGMEADAVIVRTGSDWGTDNPHWLALFRGVIDQLGAVS